MPSFYRSLRPLFPALLFVTHPVAALSLEEFAKFPQERQAQFVSAAVSMAAYIDAVDGEAKRSRCIREWYFGAPGRKGQGPDEVAAEITVAERADPKKYHVEGLILGLTERACGKKPPPKR